MVSIFNKFWGKSNKSWVKIVNTILWQSPSPISQTPIFLKEFGLFVSNTSSKVPLAVLKQVGVLTKFVRSKVSISSEKWLSFSTLDPDTSIFKFPATKILSYLLLDLLFLIILERKPSYHILVAYKWV